MTDHHSGARQWRHPCDCGNSEIGSRRMHSEVSKNNASYFISESRVGENISEDDLRGMLGRADGSLICCNHCGALRVVDG